MERKIYKIFGKVLVSNKTKVRFETMNLKSMISGIFVPENLCFEWLYDHINAMGFNPNSTFYKSWTDIISKTRLELALDQILHYLSTYGTGFEGETFTMNNGTTIDFPFKELKVLEGITQEELIPEIQKLGYSNIAFSDEILDFLYENRQYLEIEKIKNRTLKMMCIPEDYQFHDGQECLNWILYEFFNITMLVKNRETLARILPREDLLPVLEKNKEVLASVFLRNKDVFMQFKKCKELCHIINVIRKLATKLHKPMKKSPWLELEKLTYSEREKLFKSASIFKLTQMYNALNNPTGYYVIRNGKAFYNESIIRVRGINKSLLSEILTVIVSKIPKVESVALPKGIELAMPTSEKNFIGEIPLGSTVNCANKNTLIGIYWRNEWGAKDLDLHAYLIDGTSIGWNCDYYSEQDIIYSGDMTNANPEASEILWFKNQPINSIVSVSEFSGESKYAYDIFIAQESVTKFDKDYMVDPRNIIYKTQMNFEDKSNVTLGYFKDGKFVFHSCNVGHGQIPNDWRSKILNHLMECSYITIREILELAGIEISDDSEIKLTSKGDLINFFSESGN